MAYIKPGLVGNHRKIAPQSAVKGLAALRRRVGGRDPGFNANPPGIGGELGSIGNPFTDRMQPPTGSFNDMGNYAGGPMPGSMGEGRQGMPPNLMELIRQMMQQRGDQPQRSPWEGQMNHNFGNQPNRRGISQY